MNSSWKAFIGQAGGRFEGDCVAGFGDPRKEARAALTGNVVADLSHLGLIRAAGDDARSFLHNQFTNDVRQVTGSHSQLNSYCSPKGRMLTIFRLFRHGDDFHLRMPAELAGTILKRLRMFVLMSKVTLDDVSDEVIRVGVSGARAADHLGKLLGALPEEVDGTIHAAGVTVMRVPGPQPRFEIYGTESEVARLWTGLTADGATPVGADAWALLDIHAGIPTVYSATVEAFVPQMANMQAVDGVNFRKGCYPGQEIVARMQYLGQLKRRMYLAHVAGEERPLPGDPLFSPQSESGQGAGKVVDARPAPDGGHDLLAVVQIECAERGEVLLRDASGPPLIFKPLPYSYEAPDAPSASEQ